jgi:hypothetical protein
LSGSAATASVANGNVVMTEIVAGSSYTSSTASGAVGRVQPTSGSAATVSSASGAVVITTLVREFIEVAATVASA